MITDPVYDLRMGKQSVIVTGAGSGIGKATAERLLDDGWAITINGRTLDKLEKLAEELGGPADLLIVDGDVSDRSSVEALIEAHLARFGGLDAVVNNAAIALGGKIDEIDPDEFTKLMSINVTGVFNVVSLAVPHLRKSKGSIVNVSSVSGLGGDWEFSPYNTSKGAVSNFTRSIALELAADGVRANAVAPSLTDTPMASDVMENDEVMQRFRERLPMGRAAEPSEVASVIAFLLGPDASFVNGVILPVDGGLSASNGQPKLGMG